MANQIVFFHGGGSREDFEADQKLAASLQAHTGLVVDYPFLPDNGTPDLGRREQLSEKIAASDDGVILAAHSLGASMLLACLSERPVDTQISGVFLIATPFWNGEEDWVRPFRLRPDFAAQLDKTIPLFFYHCEDDDEVPFSHLEIYRQHLPWATFRPIPSGGHQLGNDLGIVAEDIAGIGGR